MCARATPVLDLSAIIYEEQQTDAGYRNPHFLMCPCCWWKGYIRDTRCPFCYSKGHLGPKRGAQLDFFTGA